MSASPFPPWSSSSLDDNPGELPLDVSEYLEFNGWEETEVTITAPTHAPETCNQVMFPTEIDAYGMGITDGRNCSGGSSGVSKSQRCAKEETQRYAFKIKAEIDMLDDGYKWRKYGKKKVKDNPNKRNYYRCSGERCMVKKRMERDRNDSSYVIVTYDGNHNHRPPFPAILPHELSQANSCHYHPYSIFCHPCSL